MIKTYHRPTSLDDALTLLSQSDTIPLGGGTYLNALAFKNKDIAVVDLQALGLTHIHKHGNNPSTGSGQRLEIEACVTLQQLLENEHTPEALNTAIKLEAPLNIRNMGTVAGTLVACDGRSHFASAMLALDAKCIVNSGQSSLIHLGDLLPFRVEMLRGKLITKVTIPLNAKFAYEYVARTPADKPIVCAALTQWPSGRTRLVVGGWGKSPFVAMDGNEAYDVETAARNAAQEAKDEWASAEYRSHVAAVLAKRCLDKILNDKTVRNSLK